MTTNTPKPEDLQRGNEQEALRKARALVDEIEQQDQKRHAMQKKMLLAGGIAVLGILGYITWQKRGDEAAEKRYACEWAAFQTRVAKVKADVARDQPTLNQREVQAEVDKQMALQKAQIRAECAAKS